MTTIDPPSDKVPYRETDAAPFIYFDVVGGLGTMANAVQIELASRILTPTPDGGVAVCFLTSGRIRCSPTAAQNLRDAIDKALQMLAEPKQQSPVAIGKLN